MVLCKSVILASMSSVSQESRKLSSLVQSGTQEPGDLFDQGFGCQKCIVLLGQFLHQLLLFVQLFQVVGTHVGKSFSLGFVTMLLISENTDGKLGSWHMAQLNSARETLVLLGIVVLQA